MRSAGGFHLMPPIAPVKPIVLAAGDSSRMGHPKALLPFGDEIFITRILRVLQNSGFPRPAIILGRSVREVRPHLEAWSADIYVNPDPDRGQLSSIQLALTNVSPEYAAGMIWPVDQPAVSEELVRGLAQLFLSSGSWIVYPRCEGKRGHPAIFRRELFKEFLNAPLEEGPGSILLRHQVMTSELPTQELATIQDIDTPVDYRALTGLSLEMALAKNVPILK
jgi:molybdenum cofactor cytidylyltransferase